MTTLETVRWGRQVALDLNLWASNKEKRNCFKSIYAPLDCWQRRAFSVGYSRVIEYDYEFTDDNF